MKVVLASASPRRRELLSALVPTFEVVPSDIDEPLGHDAVADALALAAAKALHCAAQASGAVVIGADTVVFEEGRLYGKPEDDDDAREMLTSLSGRDHKVVTGVAVAARGGVLTDASVATVTIRPLSHLDIEGYIASGVPSDKAGAYAIQEETFALVERFEGCYCSIMGLPLWGLKTLLELAGVSCGDPTGRFDRCGACPDRTAVRGGTESA